MAIATLPCAAMDYSKAATAYRQVLAVMPADLFARVNLAHCLAGMGDIRNALKEIRSASANPQFSKSATVEYSRLLLKEDLQAPAGPVMMRGSTHYRLGIELVLIGEHKAAAYEFMLAVSAEKSEIQGYRELGNMLCDSNEFGLAYVAYERYVELAPTALDRATIAVRVALMKQRHGPLMIQQLADAQAVL
jgi:predicted TPR repeat methyltransferase